MSLNEKDILKMRQEGIEEKYHSIYDSHVFIDRQYIEFAMTDIYPSMVKMMLPKSFVDMPSIIAKQKYPSEYRPTVIKTSLDLSINFAFQYFNEQIPEKEMVNTTRQYYSLLQKCYPGYGYLECSEAYRDEEEKHILAWYIYSNPTLTDTVFNLHAFTAVEGRLLQCIFNAPKGPFYHWKPYVFEAFHSITSGRDV